MSAAVPSTFEEKLKRALVPPRLDLMRVTWREMWRGEPELRILPFLLDRSRAAMDIGANRGIWANVMARHCETVWAFEPNPKLFNTLTSATGSKVRCFPDALSDKIGEASLMVPGANKRFSNQGASLSETKIKSAPHITVPVRQSTLDSLSPPPTGLLKIDVEGHERAVLDGARDLIARDRPNLMVEIEENHTGRSIDEELDFIENLGYRTFVLKHGQLVGRPQFVPATDHHIRPGSPGYINNFIFLPRD